MLIGRVIHYQIDKHSYAALFTGVCELHKIAEGPILRIDIVAVRDVVSAVAPRRWLKRHQPQSRDSKALQVVKPLHQPFEITHAVPVRIHKRSYGQAVNDGVFIPEVVDHADLKPTIVPVSDRLRHATNSAREPRL